MERFRKINKNYLRPSFETISATGSNAALPHYIPTKKSNKDIKKNNENVIEAEIIEDKKDEL